MRTLGVVDALVMRSVRRRDCLDRMIVRGDRRQLRNHALWIGGKFLIGMTIMAALTITTDVTESTWGTLVVLAMGLFIGTVPMQTFARAQSYRNGWNEGRTAAFTALNEVVTLCEDVGDVFDVTDFIESQLRQDLATLGS